MKTHAGLLLSTASFLVLTGCAPPSPPVDPALHDKSAAPLRMFEVPLSARSGSHLSGKATFVENAEGVRVKVEVAGAPPGQVATHIHEKGDCSAPDAESAGGHFNPASKPHGFPVDPDKHLGDLGNIDVAPDGKGSTEVFVKGATLATGGGPHSFLNRAIIVHEKKDDGGQPVGNAGARIGCGVIRSAG